MAINAINDGADRIILLPIFITISSHTQAGQEMVAALEPDKYGIPVSMAKPLWNSALLRERFIIKAGAALGDTIRAGSNLAGWAWATKSLGLDIPNPDRTGKFLQRWHQTGFSHTWLQIRKYFFSLDEFSKAIH